MIAHYWLLYHEMGVMSLTLVLPPDARPPRAGAPAPAPALVVYQRPYGHAPAHFREQNYVHADRESSQLFGDGPASTCYIPEGVDYTDLRNVFEICVDADGVPTHRCRYAAPAS